MSESTGVPEAQKVMNAAPSAEAQTGTKTGLDTLLPEHATSMEAQRFYGSGVNDVDLRTANITRMAQDADVYGNIKTAPQPEAPAPQTVALDQTPNRASRPFRRLGKLHTAAAGAMAIVSGLVASAAPAMAQSSSEPSPTPTPDASLPDTDTGRGNGDELSVGPQVGMGRDGWPVWINIPKDPTTPERTPNPSPEGSPQAEDAIQQNIDAYMAIDTETGLYVKQIDPKDRFHYMVENGTVVDMKFNITPDIYINHSLNDQDPYTQISPIPMHVDFLGTDQVPDTGGTLWTRRFYGFEDGNRERHWFYVTVGQSENPNFQVFPETAKQKEYPYVAASREHFPLPQFKNKHEEKFDKEQQQIIYLLQKGMPLQTPEDHQKWDDMNNAILGQIDYTQTLVGWLIGLSNGSSIADNPPPEGVTIDQRPNTIDPTKTPYIWQIANY